MRHIKSHIRTQIKITFTRSSPNLIPIIFRIPIQRLVSIFQIGIHLPFDACPRTAVREVYFSAAVGTSEDDLFLPVAEGDELGWRWVGGELARGGFVWVELGVGFLLGEGAGEKRVTYFHLHRTSGLVCGSRRFSRLRRRQVCRGNLSMGGGGGG